MSSQRPVPSTEGRRIVICDYNALLLSVTGLLRMSGYCVFQAHDGYAAQELCLQLPRIDLLILNTYGTGIDTGDLVRGLRAIKPGFPVLHIGLSEVVGLPADVPTLLEGFTPEDLMRSVHSVLNPAPVLTLAS
jgi:CheY-like chemotaxis protein